MIVIGDEAVSKILAAYSIPFWERDDHCLEGCVDRALRVLLMDSIGFLSFKNIPLL